MPVLITEVRSFVCP